MRSGQIEEDAQGGEGRGLGCRQITRPSLPMGAGQEKGGAAPASEAQLQPKGVSAKAKPGKAPKPGPDSGRVPCPGFRSRRRQRRAPSQTLTSSFCTRPLRRGCAGTSRGRPFPAAGSG